MPMSVKGRKSPLDEYRRKSIVHPRLPNDLHDLLHRIPILLITGDMTQVLELELQGGDFSCADPFIVVHFRDTPSQTKVHHGHRDPVMRFEDGHDPVRQVRGFLQV